MTVDSEVAGLLRPTEFLDYESPIVREFAERAIEGGSTATERAVSLYYAVRDKISYDVYDADLSREGMRASTIIRNGRGFCVHKSVVYAAVCRSVGIPSRLVYSDVRNHLASERLRSLVGGTLFCFHALNSVWLEGRWVKATPVFNKILCRLYGMSPLEFDGKSDSFYHAYDEDAGQFMEFVNFRGEFDDFPYDLVVGGIRTAHPRLFAGQHVTASGSLADESREA